MLNARPIDKFLLAGGWQNLPLDAAMLAKSNVKYVLDLQHTRDDEHEKMGAAIKAALAEVGIEYDYIPMYDGDFFPQDIPAIFSYGSGLLIGAAQKYPDPKDKILVKCAGGVSRSPSMLISVYGITRQWPYQQSLTYIRNKERYAPSLLMQAEPDRIFSDYLKKAFGNTEYELNPNIAPKVDPDSTKGI